MDTEKHSSDQRNSFGVLEKDFYSVFNFLQDPGIMWQAVLDLLLQTEYGTPEFRAKMSAEMRELLVILWSKATILPELRTVDHNEALRILRVTHDSLEGPETKEDYTVVTLRKKIYSLASDKDGAAFLHVASFPALETILQSGAALGRDDVRCKIVSWIVQYLMLAAHTTEPAMMATEQVEKFQSSCVELMEKAVETGDAVPDAYVPVDVEQYEVFLRDIGETATRFVQSRRAPLPAWLTKAKAAKMPPATSAAVMEEINALIGQPRVKKELQGVVNFVEMQKKRREAGQPEHKRSYHMVFTGNPGTGKTIVARKVAELYRALGILPNGQLNEVSAADLIGPHVGWSTANTQAAIKKAMGGVLFIDEAYALTDALFGSEIINTLLKEMEDKRDKFVVILAGYEKEMSKFFQANPGLKSRFFTYLYFEDYTEDELCQIFKQFCKSKDLSVTKAAEKHVRRLFAGMSKAPGGSFANGRTVRNSFEKAITAQANRLVKEEPDPVKMMTLQAADIPVEKEQNKEDLRAVLKELDSLVGLEPVKQRLEKLAALAAVQKRRGNHGRPVQSLALHMVFTGNPGTGKTTVARYMGRIYKSLGLLSEGRVIEVDRSGLVGRYVGQTEEKTNEVIRRAIGNVLFIDEAYSLAGTKEDAFGKEAIDTLLKAMEDNRDNMAVVVAGYTERMGEFLAMNPGIRSRFNQYIQFPDYTQEEMTQIFKKMCEDGQYILDEKAEPVLAEAFADSELRGGNARSVRNLFEETLQQMALRVLTIERPTRKDEDLLTADDVRAAAEQLRASRSNTAAEPSRTIGFLP